VVGCSLAWAVEEQRVHTTATRSGPTVVGRLGILVEVGAWACAEPAPDPVAESEVGLLRVGFTHNDVPREALVYVPASADPAALRPLVLNFHGYGGTGESQLQWADMRALADRDGVLVAYPTGTLDNGSPHWNNSLPSPDNKSTADDFGFVEALIDTIGARYPVDTNRVYAVGYSNGGMMVMRAACEGVPFDAAISHAGPLVSGTCPSLKIPVLRTHGTADPVIPWEGGGNNEDVVFPPVEADQAVLSVAAGCDETPGEVKEDGDMLCTYRECEVPMALCAVQDGLHAWPGGDAPRETGPRIEDIGWTWFQQVMETR